MKITILSSDAGHPVVRHLRDWVADMQGRGHEATIIFDKADLKGGDILFLVSCGHIVGEKDRGHFRATLVLHASELPRGRGWSPHIWAIVDGARRITVCLLEASEPVDTGDVWLRTEFHLDGHELLSEINEKLFAAELALMTATVERFGTLKAIPQTGDAGPYMKKRTPTHSQLDPNRTIAEQFDLLRVVDNDRYPAFFDHRGKRYTLRIDKSGDA
jgi:methionyl-tRNA formyltransferase